MVVKSATKKRLMDLGVGEDWAHQLANDRKWADVLDLSLPDWQSIVDNPMVQSIPSESSLRYSRGRSPSARMVTEYNLVRTEAGLPSWEQSLAELQRANPPNCINWGKILNLWQCKGCQRWVVERELDEYKETCNICAKAYAGDGELNK